MIPYSTCRQQSVGMHTFYVGADPSVRADWRGSLHDLADPDQRLDG